MSIWKERLDDRTGAGLQELLQLQPSHHSKPLGICDGLQESFSQFCFGGILWKQQDVVTGVRGRQPEMRNKMLKSLAAVTGAGQMCSTSILHLKTAILYLSVSEPFFAMAIFNFPSPPTGARTVPLMNWRNNLFCSSSKDLMVSQKSLCAERRTSKHVKLTQVAA